MSLFLNDHIYDICHILHVSWEFFVLFQKIRLLAATCEVMKKLSVIISTNTFWQMIDLLEQLLLIVQYLILSSLSHYCDYHRYGFYINFSSCFHRSLSKISCLRSCVIALVLWFWVSHQLWQSVTNISLIETQSNEYIESPSDVTYICLQCHDKVWQTYFNWEKR